MYLAASIVLLAGLDRGRGTVSVPQPPVARYPLHCPHSPIPYNNTINDRSAGAACSFRFFNPFGSDENVCTKVEYYGQECAGSLSTR